MQNRYVRLVSYREGGYNQNSGIMDLVAEKLTHSTDLWATVKGHCHGNDL